MEEGALGVPKSGARIKRETAGPGSPNRRAAGFRPDRPSKSSSCTHGPNPPCAGSWCASRNRHLRRGAARGRDPRLPCHCPPSTDYPDRQTPALRIAQPVAEDLEVASIGFTAQDPASIRSWITCPSRFVRHIPGRRNSCRSDRPDPGSVRADRVRHPDVNPKARSQILRVPFPVFSGGPNPGATIATGWEYWR